MFQKGFIPTIFTTAKLWVSNSDLSESSLAEGNIDLSCSDFEEKPWVLYQYHVTPGIKHSVESDQSSKDLADMLWLAYSRTIPIVNANHVKEFLSWLRAGEFFSHPY